MQIHIIFVGRTSFHELDSGIGRYLDRLQHYVPVEVHLVKAEKITPRSLEDTVREIESQRILKLLGGRSSDYLIVWDQKGQQLDSLSYARFIQTLRNEGISRLWMVIGGPLGVASSLLEQANSVLSLSRMTFPHDMARLMVMEQLYRAFSILKGEPYHK